jgi:hypothetical protein
MVDHAAARALVMAQLGAPPSLDDEWVILDEYTVERPWGWVFFYDSRRYQETRDLRFAVAGNAPYFVRRADGAIFVAGTAFPVEHYIERFEAGIFSLGTDPAG